MSTTITCTTCGKLLKISKQIADGTLVKCPRCQNSFRYHAPASGLPELESSSPVATSPPARAPALPPPLPKPPPPLPSRAAPTASVSRPRKASGSWTGFILFAGLSFATVAGGAWYFGRDYLPDLSHLFAGGNKKNVEPAKPENADKPDDKGWDRLFEEPSAKVAGQQNGADVNPAEVEPVIQADEPEPLRPKLFASKGPDDILLDPLGNKILDVEYSPDGRVLAAFDAAGLGTLWDLKTRRGLDLSFNHLGGSADSTNARHVAFSPDGKTLVFGTTNHVTVVDLPKARLRWRQGEVVESGPLLVSPTTHFVVVAERDRYNSLSETVVKVYEVSSGKSLFRIPEAPSGFKTKLIFSPDDKLLALEDGVHEKIRLFALPAGQELSGIQGVRYATDMAFTGDGRTLVLPELNGERLLWDVSDPSRTKLVHRAPKGSQPTMENLLSPDGKTLVSLPVIWDVGQRQERAKLSGNPNHGAFSPDSRMIAGWGERRDSEVAVADVTTGATLTVLNPEKETEFQARRPACVAFSDDGKQVAIGTVDGTVVLRSISGATPTAGSPASSSPAGASRELAALQFTEPDNLKHYFEGNGKTDDFATRLWIAPDRHWLVTAGHYTTLWNLEQRRQHMVLMLNDGRGTSVNQPDPPVGLGGSPKFSGSSAGPLYHVLGWLFHQDGKSLTVSGGNGSQVHYDVVAGTHRLDGKDPKCEAIKLSPDGRLAAAWMVRYQPGSPPRTRWELLVLDGRDGTVRKSLGIFERQIKRPFKYNPFQTLAFSADSRRLAAVVFPSSTDSRELPPRLLLWDWESGKDYPTTAGCDNLSRLDLIEGGNALVTIKGTAVLGGETLVAEVYDVELGSRRYEVPLNRGHTGRIFALAFDLVNPLFVTADEHGMVLLRDLKTGDPRVRFKGHDAAITAVCFSSDGTQLATAAGDRTVKLWDVASLLNSK